MTILAFDHSLLLFWSTSLKQCITFAQKKPPKLWEDKYNVIKNSRTLWESPVNKQIASVNRTLSLTAKRLNNQATAARTPVMPGCHGRLNYHYYKYVWGTHNTSSSQRFGKALLKSRDGNEEDMKEKISNRNLFCLHNLPKSTSTTIRIKSTVQSHWVSWGSLALCRTEACDYKQQLINSSSLHPEQQLQQCLFTCLTCEEQR